MLVNKDLKSAINTYYNACKTTEIKRIQAGNCKCLNNYPIVNSSFVFDVDFSEASNRSGDTGSLRAFRIPHTNLNGQEKQKLYYLISANRAHHYETSLKDALTAYDIVICDRYIGSSLALQSYDGVDIDVVWELNRPFIVPDLSIFMLACESEIAQRLSYRTKLSYFERKMTRTEEICYYKSAYDFLNKKGMTTLLLDNSAAYFDENIRIAEKRILEMRGMT